MVKNLSVVTAPLLGGEESLGRTKCGKVKWYLVAEITQRRLEIKREKEQWEERKGKGEVGGDKSDGDDESGLSDMSEDLNDFLQSKCESAAVSTRTPQSAQTVNRHLFLRDAGPTSHCNTYCS